MDDAGFVAIRRSPGRGWQFLRRDATWRLDMVGVAASLLLLQLLLLTLVGTRVAGGYVLDQGAVHIDVQAGVSEQRVQELYAELRAVPVVRDVTYVPREQVFAEEKERDASLADFMERYGIENPFSDTFVVTLQNQSGYEVLRSIVQAETWQDVIDASSLSDISAQDAGTGELIAIVEAVHSGAILIAILAAAVSLILSLTMLLRIARVRENEVRAEQLAGASPGLTADPTATAGMIALLGALVVATASAYGVIVSFAHFSQSAAMEGFLTKEFLIELMPFLAFCLLIEGVAILAMSLIVARSASAFRS